MATHHAHNDTVTSPTGGGTVTFSDGEVRSTPSRSVASQQVAPTGDVRVGGISLSPEQAAQLGYLNVPEGMTPRQALRQNDIQRSIEAAQQQHAQPSSDQHQGQPQGNPTRTALGEALGIPTGSTEEAGTEAQRAAALNASKHALEGDPDSAEAVPNHYRPEVIDPEEGHVVADFHNHFTDREQAQMLDHVLDGKELTNLSELVTNHGLQEPSQLETRMAVARAAHEEAFDRYVTDRGLDAEGFRAWAAANRSAEVGHLSRQQYRQGDPRVWSGLVSEYAAERALGDPEAAMAALAQSGIPTQRVGSEIIVTIDGVQMPLATAFKQGHLSANWS